ncbi:YkoF-like protein [Sphaerosporella brunnea]|uniref:YkoF-like protein n=1 Tax=Sphaerosporella brunnea TaxID=1250544 RepID=A0A5J5EJ49_9PEZI|nr:YkoF-like protein [Sphaerosporella brunnea]
MSQIDISTIKTPPQCCADFCLIPMGIDSASVSPFIAQVQTLLKASGLQYSMHANGTTVEGPWDEVMKVIGQAHGMLHDQGTVRVHTDIRVGSRTDKHETARSKVASVEKILSGQ